MSITDYLDGRSATRTGTDDFDGRAALGPESSAESGGWDSMDVELYAGAREWLAERLRYEDEIPPDSQGPRVQTHTGGPELPQSAVLHFNIAGGTVSGCRGRLDLPGRTVPVAVSVCGKFPIRSIAENFLRKSRAASIPMHRRIMAAMGFGASPRFLVVVWPDLGGADLRTYLRDHSSLNKRHLIIQLAEGLEYLHYQAFVVHGDLEPGFVHVNGFGDVVLHDPRIFPWMWHPEAIVFPSAALDDRPLQYVAPEMVLADAEHSHLLERRMRQTRESDVYVCLWDARVYGNVPPTHWRPDPVAGSAPWPPERSGLWEYSGPPIPADLAVQIDGNVELISLPEQNAAGGASGAVMRGYTRRHGIAAVYAVKICVGKHVMPREYDIWKSLSHSNILPLLGIVNTVTLQGEQARVFVSPYHKNGNLIEYLKSNAERKCTILPLMLNVANGLAYLHNDKRIVHGDIKPENILIDVKGQAVLADFGLSTYITPSRQETSLEIRQVYTLAYVAPEIWDDTAEYPSAPGVKRSKTTMSDMFAYGLLLYQTYAGGIGESRDERFKLTVDMYDEHFPARPVGRKPVLCEDLWSICTRCWAKDPVLRPTIATVRAETIDLMRREKPEFMFFYGREYRWPGWEALQLEVSEHT